MIHGWVEYLHGGLTVKYFTKKEADGESLDVVKLA